MTRALRGTPDATMATWQIGAALVIGIVATPFGVDAARPLDRRGCSSALLGVVALGAIICVNRSLTLAPASVVVPYQYTMIVWAMHLRLSRLRRRAAMADAGRRRHHRRAPASSSSSASRSSRCRRSRNCRPSGRHVRRLSTKDAERDAVRRAFRRGAGAVWAAPAEATMPAARLAGSTAGIPLPPPLRSRRSQRR